jgi:V/A-type H+-transporting ATPase subunit K
LSLKKQSNRKNMKTIVRKRTFYLSILVAIAVPSIVFASLSVQLVFGAAEKMNVAQVPSEFYSQYGLGLLGAAIAVAGSCLGAGIAIYGAASAGAAAIAERPETSIWVLILAGLGEGVAIYGLLIAILILGKLPAVA